MKRMRLQKFIATCGIASRRKAEELIANQQVTVNEQVVTTAGTTIDPDHDNVTVLGKVIALSPHQYYAFHKPVGVVTTMHDEFGRQCVGDYCQNLSVLVYPVGRLDEDSSGLLILTNDGEFANLVMHPKHELPKTYEVTINGILTNEHGKLIEQGIGLKEGTTAPALLSGIKINRLARQTVCCITIHQGWNRQIRRMFGAIDLPIVTIKRIGVGPIQLDNLQPGHYRILTDNELADIHKLAISKIKK